MKQKPTYYAIISAEVRYDKNLSANAKLLYGEITCLTNENGFCFATNKYFADLYDKSKVTISKWISELVSSGYLSTSYTYKEGSKEIDKRYISILKGGILLYHPRAVEPDKGRQKKQDGSRKALFKGVAHSQMHPDSPDHQKSYCR